MGVTSQPVKAVPPAGRWGEAISAAGPGRKEEYVGSKTAWFKECGWGVFTHYLTAVETAADEWNRQVDSFDVRRLADRLEEMRAPYYFITLGQISGHYCAPSETYDAIVGIRPSKCSRRDLIADVAAALEPRGIRLMVYLASEGPGRDVAAREALGWRGNHWTELEPGRDVVATWPDKRQRAFQVSWERVIREWSQRWGRKVSGWWVDGCYHRKLFYEHAEAPNFASLAGAFKAGNADAVIAFNPGVFVPVIRCTEHDDYTAGEVACALPADPGVGSSEAVGGAQYHILSYLGTRWGKGPARFPDALAAGYTSYVVGSGGVITWDVPIEKDGNIPEPFLRQLAAIGDAAPA